MNTSKIFIGMIIGLFILLSEAMFILRVSGVALFYPGLSVCIVLFFITVFWTVTTNLYLFVVGFKQGKLSFFLKILAWYFSSLLIAVVFFLYDEKFGGPKGQFFPEIPTILVLIDFFYIRFGPGFFIFIVLVYNIISYFLLLKKFTLKRSRLILNYGAIWVINIIVLLIIWWLSNVTGFSCSILPCGFTVL